MDNVSTKCHFYGHIHNDVSTEVAFRGHILVVIEMLFRAKTCLLKQFLPETTYCK